MPPRFKRPPDFRCHSRAVAEPAACNRGAGAPAGGAAAFPPANVTVLTLQPKPVERASEFIATLRSLRSSTIQPEVAGSITRIFVKAGDRVRTGTPLVQIDPDRQQAAVQSTEANRSGAEADVQYWRQQVRGSRPWLPPVRSAARNSSRRRTR